MTLRHILHFTALILIPALAANQAALAGVAPVSADQVKARMAARGTGHGVRVVLKDKSQANGMIVTLGEDDFALRIKGHPEPRTIAYADVAEIHHARLTTGQKWAIGGGIFAVAAGTAFAIGRATWDMGDIQVFPPSETGNRICGLQLRGRFCPPINRLIAGCPR